MNRKDILAAIDQEREHQDKKYGVQFDDRNTVNDWGTYINHYVAKMTQFHVPKQDRISFLIKIAALATAALEAKFRNNGFPPRHYDKAETTDLKYGDN